MALIALRNGNLQRNLQRKNRDCREKQAKSCDLHSPNTAASNMIFEETHIAWGKLSRDKSGQVTGEYSLLDHMTDVASCFLAMSECTAITRSLELAVGRPVDEVDLQRLAVLVFLHDIGKANAGFQSRRWQLPDRPPGSWPTTPFGHGPEGWELISGRVMNAERYASGLPIAEIVTWGEVAVCELLQASISHHGRPLGESPTKNSESIWKPVLDKAGAVLYDPANTLASMGERVRQRYPLAFSACHHPLPSQPAFVHLFAGLVQLADWLGSDTREGFFPYSVLGEDRTLTAPARAKYAVQAIGLAVNNWRDELRVEAPAFNDRPHLWVTINDLLKVPPSERG
jgi:CRISPR-associated endonuclease/helicase Cas3